MSETTFADAVDTYHEARAELEDRNESRSATVRVHELRTDYAPDHLYLDVERDGRRHWVSLPVETQEQRLGLADHFEIAPGESFECLLEEGEVELDGLVDDTDAEHPPVSELSGEPDAADSVVDLDRLVEFDRLYRSGRPRGHDVELSADGTSDEIVVNADLPHGSPEWRFDVPNDADELADSHLREFVEAVGAGGPEHLDGHRVNVVPRAALIKSVNAKLTTGFWDGDYAVLPAAHDGLRLGHSMWQLAAVGFPLVAFVGMVGMIAAALVGSAEIAAVSSAGSILLACVLAVVGHVKTPD